MLNISELRDGNNILDANDKIVPVTLQLRLYVKERGLKRQPDGLKGISLTYEMLAMAIKGQKVTHTYSLEKACHVEIPIKLATKKYLTLDSADNIIWMAGLKENDIEVTIRLLTYFHELQNLYFDITGENLLL
jgi:hypothetical protein